MESRALWLVEVDAQGKKTRVSHPPRPGIVALARGEKGSVVEVRATDEMPEKRTRFSRTFRWVDPDTGKEKRRVVARQRPFATKRGEDIDPAWVFRAGAWRSVACPFDVQVLQTGYSFTDEDGLQATSTFVEIGTDPITSLPAPAVDSGRKHFLRFSQVVPGLDIVLVASHKGVTSHRVLYDASAPRRFVDETLFDERLVFNEGPEIVGYFGEDNLRRTAPHKGDGATGPRARGGIDTHRALDVDYQTTELAATAGFRRVRTVAVWSGLVKKVDVSTQLVTPSTDVEYPVRVTV